MNSNGTKIINIISNRNYHSQNISKILMQKLSDKGFFPTMKFDDRADLNICVGGDGAFLRAVRENHFTKIPFIGINTGNLGFYQEISPNNIDDFIEKYIDGRYRIEKLYLVQAIVKTKRRDYTITGINEIVLRNIHHKVIHLDVNIDNFHLQTFSGDGLIISTPAGSTAYNLSAGGSVVYPSLKALQLTPIAPINSKAYRSLASSYVLPGDINIDIRPTARYKNSTLLLVDADEFIYKNLISINLSLSPRYINRVVLDSNVYWNNIRNKFL